MKIRNVAAIGLLLLAAESAATLNGERKSFQIVRVDTPPVIDGRLDDTVWAAAYEIDDFHQTSPGDGTPSTERTVVRVAYDDEYLYIAANLLDSGP